MGVLKLKNKYYIGADLNAADLELFNYWHNWLIRESLFGEPSKAEAMRISIRKSAKIPDILNQIDNHIQRVESIYSNLTYFTKEIKQVLDGLVRLKEAIANKDKKITIINQDI